MKSQTLGAMSATRYGELWCPLWCRAVVPSNRNTTPEHDWARVGACEPRAHAPVHKCIHRRVLIGKPARSQPGKSDNNEMHHTVCISLLLFCP